MPLEDLLETATSWLVKGGAVFLALTLVAFIAKWGLRFRLVGVTSFTFVLAISCWAFGLSYTLRQHRGRPQGSCGVRQRR